MKLGARIKFSHCLSAHLFFLCFSLSTPPSSLYLCFLFAISKETAQKMHLYLGQEIGQFLHCKRDLLKHNKTVRIPESSSTLKHKYKGIGKLTSPKNFFSKFTFKNHRLFCLLWHLAVFQAGLSHHECPLTLSLFRMLVIPWVFIQQSETL